MFGKVVKHELRTSAILYLVCFGIALLFCVATIFNGKMAWYGNVKNDLAITVWMFLILACSISIVVLVLMYSVDTAIRYDRSMYGREGYLTFTLPISSTQLVLGKLTASVIWGIGVFVLCGLLCFSILYSTIDSTENIMKIWEMLRTVFSQSEIVSSILLFLGLCLVGILETVATIYFSICIAYLPCFRKGNRMIALGLFCALTYVENKILEFYPIYQDIVFAQDAEDMIYNSIQHMLSMLRELFVLEIVLGTVFTVLYIGVTIYITKKHTSLQ